MTRNVLCDLILSFVTPMKFLWHPVRQLGSSIKYESSYVVLNGWNMHLICPSITRSQTCTTFVKPSLVHWYFAYLTHVSSFFVVCARSFTVTVLYRYISSIAQISRSAEMICFEYLSFKLSQGVVHLLCPWVYDLALTVAYTRSRSTSLFNPTWAVYQTSQLNRQDSQCKSSS